MLPYKNGKFRAPGVSFILPEGYWLETEPAHPCEYGLGAWTPDRQCYVQWQVELNCMGTERELEGMLRYINVLEPLSAIRPITVNGLSGHQVMYRSRRARKEYWEVLLDLGGGNQLRFLVWSRQGNIQKRSRKADIQAALYGISREE